jgi:tetratricopeptide (TPR) repeat protein
LVRSKYTFLIQIGQGLCSNLSMIKIVSILLIMNNAWDRSYRLARIYLAKHRPEKALCHLKNAVSTCPVENRKRLSHYLYFLGVSLYKLDQREAALRSWKASLKAWNHPYSRKFFKRVANVYGMAKGSCIEEDDWKMFYTIQVEKYLRQKRSHSLGTIAERDMILELIKEYWFEIRDLDMLRGLSYTDKLNIFRNVDLVFPFFDTGNDIPEGIALFQGRFQEGFREPIQVDFRKKVKITLEDDCPCGSGLPYVQCCGKNPMMPG